MIIFLGNVLLVSCALPSVPELLPITFIHTHPFVTLIVPSFVSVTVFIPLAVTAFFSIMEITNDLSFKIHPFIPLGLHWLSVFCKYDTPIVTTISKKKKVYIYILCRENWLVESSEYITRIVTNRCLSLIDRMVELVSPCESKKRKSCWKRFERGIIGFDQWMQSCFVNSSLSQFYHDLVVDRNVEIKHGGITRVWTAHFNFILIMFNASLAHGYII